MQFTRSPPPDRSPRHESPLDRKIRELQEVSESQSWKVRQLLMHENQLSRRSHNKPFQNPSPRASFQQSKQETVRTRYHYEEFLEEQALQEAQTSQREARKKYQEPVAMPAAVEAIEHWQLDQQMQYFKSEEYQQYLQGVAAGHSPKAKATVYEKHTHQLYGRATKRQLPLQQVRSPVSRHSVSINSFRKQTSSPQNRYWRNEPVLQHPSQRSPKGERMKSRRFDPHLQKDQNRGRAEYRPPHIHRNALKQRQLNDPLNLSASGLEEQKSSEGSLHKQVRKQCNKLPPHPPRNESFRRSVSPLPCKDKQTTPMKQTRIETYRRQLEFCHRQQEKPKRASKNKHHKYSCGFKINDNDKENMVLESISSSHSPSPKKSPYEISFKIERQTHKKHTYEDARAPKPKPTNINSNHYYFPLKKQASYHKEKVRTKPSCHYTEHALEQSHTSSTAARTDNHTKRSQKMSVISRSKIK